MRLSALVIVALALIGAASPVAGQTAVGSVRGTAMDASGAVLPGVTVIAAFPGGRPIATTVTDEAGGYLFGALPPGRVDLTFQLDGFATVVSTVAVHPGAESFVVERLSLARLAETVLVVGDRPAEPPPPRPRPVVAPVQGHDPDSICGPAKASAGESLGTIQSARLTARHGLYASGDELTIDRGTLNGFAAGQNFVVRRHYRANGLSGTSTGDHTSGLLQIVEADERSSVAVVVYACDEMMKGDFLAAFKPEPVRAPEPFGIPVYDAAARILFADAGQLSGVSRRLMVIDRGTDQGMRAGQRLTLFRQRRSDPAPIELGDAVVVATRADSATIRVERASDPIVSGDLAAPQRPRPSSLTLSPAPANFGGDSPLP